MKKIYTNSPAPIRFKRFSHKAWALFSVLGKVVLIGVLSVATLQHAKASGIAVETDLAKDSLTIDEIGLDEVVVEGSGVPIPLLSSGELVEVLTRGSISHATSGASINDVFKEVASLDVRQRGAFGVQTDIGIRGSTFDAIGFAVNGVPFLCPQTGHLAADFPLSAEDIESIELYKSGVALLENGSTLSGSLNLNTLSRGNFVNANVSAGSYGTINGNANIGAQTGCVHSFLSGGYTRSDGATVNSAFNSSRLFYAGDVCWGRQRVGVQASFSYKPFEANTFYGSGSTEQWEAVERISAAATGDFIINKVELKGRIAWNRVYDHYQWVRHSAAGENFHLSDAGEIALNALVKEAIGQTSFGAMVTREQVYSTSLGEELQSDKYVKTKGISSCDSVEYTHFARRFIASAYVEQSLNINRWALSVALSGAYTRLDHFSLLPKVALSYKLNNAMTLYFRADGATRLPTFTDLYYSGVNIEGNNRLTAEHSWDLDGGVALNYDWLTFNAEAYFSHKRDMIDWVLFAQDEEDIYRSTNFLLNACGFELNALVNFNNLFHSSLPLRSLSLSYALNNQHSRYPQPIRASKYALDYIRMKLIVRANIVVLKRLNIDLSFRVNKRDGKGNGSYALLDGKVSWQAKHYTLFFTANNILNRKYFDYISVPQPRFTFISGIELHI